jgi:hypothetical protein
MSIPNKHARVETKRDPDGCPMFAPAYMGRKRGAEPIESFLVIG